MYDPRAARVLQRARRVVSPIILEIVSASEGVLVSSAHIEKVNFWLPTIAGALGIAFSAGIAYAVIGSDVARNSSDIQAMKDREATIGATITDVRIAQGKILTQLDALSVRVDTATRILERRFGTIPPRPPEWKGE